jgi:hypothetical protein
MITILSTILKTLIIKIFVCLQWNISQAFLYEYLNWMITNWIQLTFNSSQVVFSFIEIISELLSNELTQENKTKLVRIVLEKYIQ